MSELVKRLHDAENLCNKLGFSGSARAIFDARKRITELEASLADSNEALQVMGLKLAQAEGHSANTVGEREACPACGDDVEHVWCLISPEGKRFTGDTKMAAYREEASSRIPATEQLANIMRANAECEAEYQADLEQARKQGYQSGYAAGLEVNSANTVGGPTFGAAPACEQPAKLRVKTLWCASLENWWNLATDEEKKKAYSSSIEADTWKAKRIRELDEDLADVRGAAKTLEKVCDESLDMRPEFLYAVSRLHTAIANSERCPNCDCGDYQQFHHDGSRGTPECWWWECSSCGYKTQPE